MNIFGNKPEYPIIYEKSFLIFWGTMLALSLYGGGLLMFAFTATAILVLIHHEHAHLKQCMKRNVKVNSVIFTWYGGGVNADIVYAHDAVPILLAGVTNTGYYAVAFIAMLGSYHYIGRTFGMGINFANNPYIAFLNSLTLFTVIMVFTNVLPISIKSKEHGIISTDGWGAIRFIELRDELWNDGAHDALVWTPASELTSPTPHQLSLSTPKGGRFR